MVKITGTERHPFICVDSGTQKYFEFDKDGNVTVEARFPGYSFDVWHLADDTVLTPYYGEGSGFRITDRKGNEIRKWVADSVTEELFGCLPLTNGDIVLGDLRKKALVRVDTKGNIVSSTPLTYFSDNPHETMRMPRLTRDGKNYLIVHPGDRKIRKYTPEGKVIWDADTHADTFTAIEKPNGNIVYGSIEGLFELDKNGKEVWSVYPDEIPEVGFKWALALQLLENGNLVVCNWLGHGHDGEGVPLFEITHDKEIVWSCDVHDIATNLCSFQLLDVKDARR